MNDDSFRIDGDFPEIRSGTRGFAIAEAAATVIALLVILFVPGRTKWGLLLLVAGAALAILLLLLARLRSSYLGIPVVREKRTIEMALRSARTALAHAQALARAADARRKSLSHEEEREAAKRQASHSQALANLAARRAQLDATEARERADRLEALRQSTIAARMSSADIDGAKIQGIGPKLKERLKAVGVQSAATVHQARLTGLAGFGEAKVAALLAWRESIEQEAIRSSPTTLPSEDTIALDTKYAAARQGFNEEEAAAHASLAEDLSSIRERAQSLRAEADEEERSQNAQAEQASATITAVQAELLPYTQVTPIEYLKVVARPSEGKAAIAPTIPLLIAGGGLLFIAAGSGSVAGVIAASIPTSTPTVTVTATATLTPLPTSTLTPTITPTPTKSPTPTITPTASQTPTPSPSPTHTITVAPISHADCLPPGTLRQAAQVVDVVDGDTIQVTIDGVFFEVRYIGIDSPELNQPSGYDARTTNAGMVSGRNVVLVKDVSETDKYERLLRYVLVGNTFVNREMVATGYAYASSYRPDTACDDALSEAEELARSSRIGLWNITPTRAPTAEGWAPDGGGGGGSCSPYYPDVCIAPPPPDLLCGNIPYRRFRVVGGDPHRFDGDGDGIGCES